MNTCIVKSTSPCFSTSTSLSSRAFSPTPSFTPSALHSKEMRRHCPSIQQTHHTSTVFIYLYFFFNFFHFLTTDLTTTKFFGSSYFSAIYCDRLNEFF